MVRIERSRALIFGIDHKRVGSDVCACSPAQGIGQQGRTQAFALETLVHGQAPMRTAGTFG